MFLQISRGWSHSELGYLERCDATPTWIREYFQDADGLDGQRYESISSQLRKEHLSSCTWQGMPGSEGGMPNLEHQRGTSHLTSHLLLESGLVPFLWHVGILVALRFFSTDHSDLFHTALKCSQKMQFPVPLHSTASEIACSTLANERQILFNQTDFMMHFI